MDQTNEPDWDRLLLNAAELARFRSGEDPVWLTAQNCFLHYLGKHCSRAMKELRRLAPLGGERELDAGIRTWAGKFRLLEKGKPPRWIIQAAKLTIQYWSMKPDANMMVGPLLIAPERRDDSLTWNPALETMRSFKRRMRVHVETLVGAQRAPVTHTAKHYEWLARRLANGETPSAIAGKDHADVAAIKKGIREAGRVLGLDLHKRGRPPKKTT